jgi:hypothetical protein
MDRGWSREGSPASVRVFAFLTMISQLRQAVSASCAVLQDDVLNKLVQTGYQKLSQSRQARKIP